MSRSDSQPTIERPLKTLAWRQIRQGWKISETWWGDSRSHELVSSGDLVGILSHTLSSKSFQMDVDHGPFSRRGYIKQASTDPDYYSGRRFTSTGGTVCAAGGANPSRASTSATSSGRNAPGTGFGDDSGPTAQNSLASNPLPLLVGTYYSVFLGRVRGVISNPGESFSFIDRHFVIWFEWS